ncbi:MAG: chloride channel protein, partial [Candidatus Omnitrophica bacterium]|nr:chloride channel protein [Candidatus Omnitrophota bacterium]
MKRNEEDKDLHGLPIAPSMQPALHQLESDRLKKREPYHLLRMIWYSFILGLIGGGVAWILTKLIYIITNAAFYGQFSSEHAVPEGHALGWMVIFVPVIGGILVGLMARYGSQGIRGHGIPEAMEHVLHNQSRIPPRLAFLKPLSSAVTIGTGGPFGAEGPIIATGGALGSLLGQLKKTTADERKILLAAGAAAGMSATFGSPVSAVLLVMELLLFELRAFSIIPVAIASVTAVAVRFITVGSAPVFPMTDFPAASATALFVYTIIGCGIGVLAVAITKIVYSVEELFERL